MTQFYQFTNNDDYGNLFISLYTSFVHNTNVTCVLATYINCCTMPFSIDPIFYGAKFYTQTKTLDIAGLENYNTEELYNLKPSKMSISNLIDLFVA